MLEEAYVAAGYLLRAYGRDDAAEAAGLTDKLPPLPERVEEEVFGGR